MFHTQTTNDHFPDCTNTQYLCLVHFDVVRVQHIQQYSKSPTAIHRILFALRQFPYATYSPVEIITTLTSRALLTHTHTHTDTYARARNASTISARMHRQMWQICILRLIAADPCCACAPLE